MEFQSKTRIRAPSTCHAGLVAAKIARRFGVDNSNLFGLTSHPGSLDHFIRLAPLIGIYLTYIPEHEP